MRARADLAAMLLGYDLDPGHETRTLAGYLTARDELAQPGARRSPTRWTCSSVFADFAELSRNRPVGEEAHIENRVHSPREHFHTYLQTLDPERGALPADFVGRLERVLGHYGVTDVERSEALEGAVFRVFLAQQRSAPEVAMATSILQRWLVEPAPEPPADAAARELLDRLVVGHPAALPDRRRPGPQRALPLVRPAARRRRPRVGARVRGRRARARSTPCPTATSAPRRVDALAAIPERIVRFLGERLRRGVPGARADARRAHQAPLPRVRAVATCTRSTVDGRAVATADYALDEPRVPPRQHGRHARRARRRQRAVAACSSALVDDRPADHEAVVDLYVHWADLPHDKEEASAALAGHLAGMPFAATVRRVAVGVVPDDDREVGYFTFRPQADGTMEEDRPVRDVHPMVGRRLNLWRLRDFELTRLEAPEDVLLLHAVAAGNPSDQRLVALAQVRQLVVVRDETGKVTALPHIERALANCLEAVRRARTTLGSGARLDTNHVWLHIWPPVEADLDQLTALQGKVAPMTAGAGIEEVRIQGAIAGEHGHTVPICARFSYQPGSGVTFTVEPPPTTRVAPLDGYAEKVVRARRRGLVYPYELVAMVAGAGGSVQELDLDDAGRLVPVDRPYGENTAGLICGLVSTPTALHPDGVTRVLLCGDPLRALGAVAEPECARVIAALDLAEERGLPVEWFAISAGARISMDSGTENMDWVARALKRIIEFTQAGHEINVVVAGINVGAQPYWNAEATMLMHTKGILVMTPDSAMVLTGKQSLDFSGGVSAEDNFGIGGYDRVMGPNGQAQYWAPDLAAAYGILLSHYENTWVAPGDDGPRRAPTSDPVDRDVTTFPHSLAGSDFTTVGDIFSPATNPDRKKAFDIRTVMRAVADQDHPTLERWAGMADAETAVVVDARLGGIPVCLLGIESRSVPRRGVPPTDGPDVYTAGTLFPRSSKKAARAINAASGNRPLVVLANLSGFDGSPDSMRALQLEYGAEIGRAVVNFDGPIVFVVISRYHGGAFVVFSKALNPRMTVLAVEGSFASVIGGAPAAAVVFARDVDARTAADPRVAELQARVGEASGAERAALATELASVRTAVRAEMLGRVASEFDRVHDIHRAVRVGSVDAVIAPDEIRPRIVAAIDAAAG